MGIKIIDIYHGMGGNDIEQQLKYTNEFTVADRMGEDQHWGYPELYRVFKDAILKDPKVKEA